MELFYNSYITDVILKSGGQTTKVLDKGSVELVGPFGIQKGLDYLSKSIDNLNTGVITSYALYILIGFIFYIVMPYISLNYLSLVIFFGLFILSNHLVQSYQKINNIRNFVRYNRESSISLDLLDSLSASKLKITFCKPHCPYSFTALSLQSVPGGLLRELELLRQQRGSLTQQQATVEGDAAIRNYYHLNTGDDQQDVLDKKQILQHYLENRVKAVSSTPRSIIPSLTDVKQPSPLLDNLFIDCVKCNSLSELALKYGNYCFQYGKLAGNQRSESSYFRQLLRAKIDIMNRDSSSTDALIATEGSGSESETD